MLAAGLMAVLLCVVAVLSLAKDRHHSPARRLVWLLIVVAVPVVGPLLWLAVASRRPSEHRPSSARPSDRCRSSRSSSGRDRRGAA